MYVCPHCHEEIPDRVKQTKDECPFCHEPWPGEPAPDPEQAQQSLGAAPAAAGGGQAAAGVPQGNGAPAQDEHAPMPEPESKSKLWIILVILLVVVGGGGAAAYFLLFKGDKKSDSASIVVTIGKDKVKLKKLYGQEFEQMVSWHNEIRKAMLSFLASRCDPYRKKGFKFASRLVTREKLISSTEKIQKLELEIQQKQGTPVALKGFNWFKCPGILAYVHKEHEMGIEMSFSIKERTLGSDIKRATIEIKGGQFVGGKGKYKAHWDMGRSGLRFPGLKKTKAKEHPWLLKLRSNPVSRKKDGVFLLAGVPFKRVDTGKHRSKSFLVGTWKAKLSTDTFRNLLNTWSGTCASMKKKIRSINKKYAENREKFKVPLFHQKAVEIGVNLCKGLKKVAKSVEPWKNDDVKSGRKRILESFNKANDLLRTPLVKLGKKIKNNMKPDFWCGDYKKAGSSCKKK